MSPLMQLFLTVLVVAGGLFVYDAFLQRSPDTVPEVIERGADRAVVAEAEEVRPFAVLEGTGDDLWRDGVDRRLEALEEQGTPTSRTAGESEAADDGSSPGGEASGEEVASGDDPVSEDPDAKRPVDREELKRFRKMLEAVERQRRWEKAARTINDWLDKIGSSLTDEQRRDVIKTTLTFQERWRRLSKMPTNDEQQKQERRAAGQALFTEYERAIHDCAPAAEADLIIQAIQGRGDRR